MNVIKLELKPNRLLLDSNFDGYKLSLAEIPLSKIELQTPVDKVFLTPNQYSFLHAKLFGLHNHIIADKYDDFNSIYFVDQDLNIQKTYVDSLTNELVAPITIYSIPKTRPQQTGDYNVTLRFASPQYATLSDGKGTLYILDTRDKKDDDFFETVFSGKVLDNEEQGYIITDALYHEEKKELHVLLVNIEEDPLVHFITIIHWLTFKIINSSGDQIWGQTALRRLSAKGEVQYLHLESNCDHIYVVSEKEVKFELNSEHPVQDDQSDQQSLSKIYKWSQDIEEINIKITLPGIPEKNLVSVTTDSTNIDIQYEAKTILSGELCEKIDSSLTTWTLEGNILQIVLNKQEETGFWPELVKGDNKGEYVLDSCIIDQVNDRLGSFTSDREAVPPTGTTFNSQQIEECDFELDKAELFERISGITNRATHRIHLGSHHIVLSPYLCPEWSPALGIKHDVDLCLWQPLVENGDFTLKHEGTLLAFAYVQASKQNRKFTTCSPNLEYAVISESSGHIFIYFQNKPLLSTELRHRATGRQIKNVAQQQVLNLPNQEVLGLFANNKHLFILGENFIMSLCIGLQ